MEPLLKYFIIPVLAAVAAGFGAYFGAYAKKRAEDAATHEGIDTLIADTGKMTEAVKGIEAKISNEMWDRQTRWETRKDVILETLRSVGKAQSIMAKTISALGRYDAANSEEERSEVATEATELVGECKEAVTTLTESLTLISLVSGIEVIDAFISVNNSFGEVTEQFKDAAMRMDRYRAFSRAVGLLQRVIRKELGIPDREIQDLKGGRA